MTWSKLDDGWDDNPKIQSVSDAAVVMWLRAITYCNRKKTDGFVPWTKLPELTKSRRKWRVIANELIDVRVPGSDSGLFDKDADDRGVWVHDFLVLNYSRAQLDSRKSAESEAGRRGAQARWQQQPDGVPHAPPHSPPKPPPHTPPHGVPDGQPQDGPHAPPHGDSDGVPMGFAHARPVPVPDPSGEKEQKNARTHEEVRGLRLPPADFAPNGSDYGVGQEENLTAEQVNAMVDQFLDTHRSSGKASADWHAEFRRYIRNRKVYQQSKAPSRVNGNTQPPQPTAPASHKYIKPPEPLTPDQCRESAKAAKEILDTMFGDEATPDV